jgi:formylglycine-generating enzyme required for sulfatase activity
MDQGNDETEFDVNRGLDFCTTMLEQAVKTDGRLRELRDWLSVRRGGRGDRTPMSPRDHLLFYEILYQEALRWLLNRNSRIEQVVYKTRPHTVAVIATTEDLGNERFAVAEHLRRTPGIGEVREIHAEKSDGLSEIPVSALRVVLLGCRTGGTAVLKTAISSSDNCIVIASKSIDANVVDIAELTEILSLRKLCAATQLFASIEQAVAVAQDQVAEWIARQSATNPSYRINLNSWESSYLRQRLSTWEQGHHGPLQARRSKNQRLDRSQLYVSLRVESNFCFEDRNGNLIVLPNTQDVSDSKELDGKAQGRLFDYEHRRAPTFIERAVSQPSLRHLVIEGEAGSGKTVSLQHIAYAIGCYHLARPLPPNNLELQSLSIGRPLVPIPLFMEARVLAESLSELDGIAGLVHSVESEIKKATGQEPPTGEVIEGLIAGRYLLLIDSLDEVPNQDSREAVAQCLAGVSNQEWRSSFVLTTRPTAYTGSVNFGGNLRQIRIAHLDTAAVQSMVNRWSAFHNYGSDEQEMLFAAVNEVAARHGGANMAENPLLLTVTMLVYDQQEQLPDSTADLYKRIVEILCETRKSDITPATRRQLLELIFEGAQRAGGTSWRVDDAIEWLRRARPDIFTNADIARAMLDRLGNETGLVLFESPSRTGSRKKKVSGSGPEIGQTRVVLRPWHRSFQEYLAACRLASGVESVSKETERLFEAREEGPAIVQDPTWEGVLRFLVGVYGDQGVDRARAYIERLYDHFSGTKGATITSRPGRILGLVASGLTEYREYFRGHSLHDSVRTDIIQEFQRSGVTWPLVDRLLALEALGRLGDPRLESPRWIELSGGRVSYPISAEESGEGSTKRKVQQKSMTVGPFRILWSPITVHDYRPFVETGYVDKKWWDPEAVSAFSRTPVRDRRNADRRLEADVGRQDTIHVGPLPSAPADWARQIHHPNRPVVGVSWYEARAFCRWATENWPGVPGRYVIDLPSEGEWCFAAYGAARDKYPWGRDEPGDGDRARAAFVQSGSPDVATPVGAFPLGQRHGIVDLFGNVWEWCRDTSCRIEDRSTGPLKHTGVESFGLLKGGCRHGLPLRTDRDRRDDVPLIARLPCHGFRVVIRPEGHEHSLSTR